VTVARVPVAARRRVIGPLPRIDWLPTLLVLPALLVLAVVLLYPIVVGIRLSLFDVAFVAGDSDRFVGLDNYARMLRNGQFWQAFRVTVIYTTVVVTASFLIGLGTALLLNVRFRGRAVLRTIAIIPWPIPEVVAVMIWAWMFSADFGVINYFVSLVAPGVGKIAWLSDPSLALPAVSMVTIWKQFPLATVMILAGLQHIPLDHYEAAAVDGANARQRFRYITWPGLRHVNLVLVLLLVLYTFKRVTIIFVMTGGGPGRATETLPIQTYLQSFQFFDMGYASAIGALMLTVAMSFTLVYLALTRRDPEQV